MSIIHTPPARNRPLTGDARRWAAARDEYLAGSPADAVCRRHDLRLATFRRRALREGWRRMDQPAPSLAPDPAPAPSSQDDPLVIPEAPEALSGTPLTAAQMVDKCWSHIQAAVAAGRQIEARGWMRLYNDLKPFARYEATAAREARMEQEAAAREAEVEAPEKALADEQSVALPLHCFSAPESHAPALADHDPMDDPAAAEAATPISTSDLARLAARLATVAQQVEQAVHHEAARLPLHCFSRPESHEGPVDDLDQAMRDLQTDILGLRADGSRTPARPGAP